MVSANIPNKCKDLRRRLFDKLFRSLSLDSGWLAEHIADCKRCQQRLGHFGKVNVAFSLLKSQPHNLDLLMRANTQTVRVLKHGLRNSAKAAELKTQQPDLEPAEKCLRRNLPIFKAAACIAVILLLKTGIFTYMNRFQDKSASVIKHHYAKHLDQQMVDDIFST